MRIPRSAVAVADRVRRAAGRSPGSRRSGRSRRRRGRPARGRCRRRRAGERSSAFSAAPAWSAANAIRISRRASVAGMERRDAAAEPAPDDPSRDVGDASTVNPNSLEDRRRRGRRAEVVDADHRALVARVALPAERDAGLDRHPRPHGARQHGLPVRRRPAPRSAPSTGARRPAPASPPPRGPRPRPSPAAAPSPSRRG